jgi:hypothetical protein
MSASKMPPSFKMESPLSFVPPIILYLYCLGSNDKKSVYTYLVQKQFFPNMVDLQVVEFAAVEATDREG